jgi:hypothetical protein
MLIRYRPISPVGADVAIALNPNGRIAGQPRIATASPDSILTRMRGLAQRVRTQPYTAAGDLEYAFLVGSLVDHATLDRAAREAERTGVATHTVLLAAGWVSQADYAAALARVLGVEAAPSDLFIDGDSAAMRGAEAEQGLPAVVRGSACRVLSSSSASPSELGARVALLRSRGLQVMLAPQSAIDAIREVHGWGDHSQQAVRSLLRERPALSAGTRTWTGRSWRQPARSGLPSVGYTSFPKPRLPL